MPIDEVAAQVINTKESSAATTTSSSNTVLSSACFQPKIIDAYLQSSLDSIDFPKDSIQNLRVLLRDHLNDDGINIEIRAKRVYDDFKEILNALSIKQRGALEDTIKALSAQLIILSKEVSDTNTDPQEELWKRRCLFGYCKILDEHWKEAIVELDVVRSEVHRWIGTRQEGQDKGRKIKSLYNDSLYGLELASLLLAKHGDAARYAKWRKAAR